jgi:DNA polymerase I-like protein with 3'-5' exonuclease and polymerase domains
MKLVLDVENTVQWTADGRKDLSPYHPANRLVSVGWCEVYDDGRRGDVQYIFFHHNDLKQLPVQAYRKMLQGVIDRADAVIAHNAKHDISWLEECGFDFGETAIEDTMLGEYILARGRKWPMSLEASCERRHVALKKAELIDQYFSQKIGFEAMPVEIVEEYGRGDIVSCYELWQAQQTLYENDWNAGLVPTLRMVNQFCRVLIDMERGGIMVDLAELDKVEQDYLLERELLTKALQEQVFKLMGDTPINLGSTEMLSRVIYSRSIDDKKAWKKTFNIGTDDKGKQLRRTKMNQVEFRSAVSTMTTREYKTKATQCPVCEGRGFTQKIRKDGTPFAKTTKCKNCSIKSYSHLEDKWIDQPTGIIYENTKELAGLKISPSGVDDTAAHGFSTDKTTLQALADTARVSGKEEAALFLEGLIRLSAVETYLSNFCVGIRRGVQPDGRIHPSFNQAITSTGRLSSSNPNFQNMPRGGTFPIKRAIKSRFERGVIIEADFSGLEFVIAAELSRCPQAIADILAGKDIHKQTASIIFQIAMDEVTKDQRQAAKPFTFSPLYGGAGMGMPDHIRAYFQEFFNVYPGIKEYHDRLIEGVIRTKVVRLPTGREYCWPGAQRTAWGSVTYKTQVVNYPIQGAATGDLVPIACIRLRKMMKQHKVRSVFCNTVHDSLVLDCPPDEVELMKRLIATAMLGLPEEVKSRYGYEMVMPLNAELKVGPNWLDADYELGKKEVRALLDDTLPLAA